MKQMLESNNPKFKVKKGFAQISKNKKIIDISSLKENDEFNLMNDKIIIDAKVIHKNII